MGVSREMAEPTGPQTAMRPGPDRAAGTHAR